MRFTTALVSAAAFVSGAQARGGPSARNDPHILDFRLWGTSTCTNNEYNLGIWTVLQSDTGKCTKLNENDPSSPDVHGIYLGDVSDGYKIFFYTDDNCGEGETEAILEQCAGTDSLFKTFIVRK